MLTGIGEKSMDELASAAQLLSLSILDSGEIDFSKYLETLGVEILDCGLSPAPGEAEAAAMVKDRTIITCQIDRAYCGNVRTIFHTSGTPCYDAPQPSSSSFTLVAVEHDWNDLDGRCLLVTGEVVTGTVGGKPVIFANEQSQVEFCQ